MSKLWMFPLLNKCETSSSTWTLHPIIVQLMSKIVNAVRIAPTFAVEEGGEHLAKSSMSHAIVSSFGAAKSNVKRARSWWNETSACKKDADSFSTFRIIITVSIDLFIFFSKLSHCTFPVSCFVVPLHIYLLTFNDDPSEMLFFIIPVFHISKCIFIAAYS